MNLHEFQGKQLFREYGLPVSKGFAVTSASDAVEAAKKIGLKPKIQYLRNPRIEQPKHFYKPSNKSFIKIGLKKRKFSEEFII